jgi:hypothetical protein
MYEGKLRHKSAKNTITRFPRFRRPFGDELRRDEIAPKHLNRGAKWRFIE